MCVLRWSLVTDIFFFRMHGVLFGASPMLCMEQSINQSMQEINGTQEEPHTDRPSSGADATVVGVVV